MKLVFPAFLLLGLQLTAQPPAASGIFQVKGTFTEKAGQPDWVYLSYVIDGERKTDSSLVRHGQYKFKGPLKEPALARIYRKADTLVNGQKQALSRPEWEYELFLAPGTAFVKHGESFNQTTVSGSVAQTDYWQLRQKVKPFEDQISELNDQYRQYARDKDEAGMKALSARYDEIDARERKVYAEWVKSNPASLVSPYALKQFAGWEIDPAAVDPVMALLPETSRNLPSMKELARRVEVARKTEIGREAMDFVQNDTAGIPVKLSSLRGNYVLVDFWASWCGPCRAESPNLVKAYEDYHQKGFRIIGVSLDQPNGKEKWLAAIHHDELFWTQVSDLKFWKNEVAVQYGIQAIPQNFLLDPQGKIIAKNLRGDDLVKKLSEIFNKPNP